MGWWAKGKLIDVSRNMKYKNSWNLKTEHGKHFTNSPKLAVEAERLVGLPVDLKIMRYGRVIGIRAHLTDE